MCSCESIDSTQYLIKLRDITSTGKVIGKGAYGRVIEVYVQGTSCAAKEVHPILIDGISPTELNWIKTSFLSECINASQLHHPNIVQVLGIHYPTPEAKLPWLVMEMMECSLTNFLEKYKKKEVPLHIKLSILVDISQGLEFLHGQNIIHRDLSSNNVLMTKHCVTKIADLGVAKVMDDSRMKMQTQVPGTLHFMPPETLLVKPRYGKPVDVFSLGCVACHVMSHQWPVPKDLLPEGSLTALTEVERRDKYLKSCSEVSLRELVESYLHNSPDERPEISAVCTELEELKFTITEKISFPIGTIELFNAVQKQKIQIDELVNTVKTMEATIRELLLKEVKYQRHNTVSGDFSTHNRGSGRERVQRAESDVGLSTKKKDLPRKEIAHNKKPVASPRSVRRTMTNPVMSSTAGDKSNATTLRLKSWYCRSCDHRNDGDTACESCSNGCGEFAGYCSRCDLVVSVSSEKNKVECPFCFLDLEVKKV